MAKALTSTLERGGWAYVDLYQVSCCHLPVRTCSFFSMLGRGSADGPACTEFAAALRLGFSPHCPACVSGRWSFVADLARADTSARVLAALQDYSDISCVAGLFFVIVGVVAQARGEPIPRSSFRFAVLSKRSCTAVPVPTIALLVAGVPGLQCVFSAHARRWRGCSRFTFRSRTLEGWTLWPKGCRKPAIEGCAARWESPISTRSR